MQLSSSWSNFPIHKFLAAGLLIGLKTKNKKSTYLLLYYKLDNWHMCILAVGKRKIA